jgi:two-component sensor histidine kinase
MEKVMSNDVSSFSPISAAKSSADNGQTAMRDLRMENLKLRGQIKDLEQRSLKHAVMLREGDHRIKNSLQLVASLMRLQAARESGRPARVALDAAAARVSCVAGIHDALQASRGLDRVDLGAALRKMCASLHAMAGEGGRIEICVDAIALEIPVALAQPVLLAANELVVNALRHAFPGHDNGSIRVSLSRSPGGFAICVADNGVGLPPDHAPDEGYGMSLVHMMVKQIGGRLEVDGSAGTCFTIHATLADG